MLSAGRADETLRSQALAGGCGVTETGWERSEFAVYVWRSVRATKRAQRPPRLPQGRQGGRTQREGMDAPRVRRGLLAAICWSGWRDSNSRTLAPKPPAAPRPPSPAAEHAGSGGAGDGSNKDAGYSLKERSADAVACPCRDVDAEATKRWWRPSNGGPTACRMAGLRYVLTRSSLGSMGERF